MLVSLHFDDFDAPDFELAGDCWRSCTQSRRLPSRSNDGLVVAHQCESAVEKAKRKVRLALGPDGPPMRTARPSLATVLE